MKTGSKTGLSERIALNMQQMREDQHDLLQSAFQSFESNLQVMLSDALDTTKGDIAQFTQSTKQSIEKTRSNIAFQMAWAQRLAWASPAGLFGGIAIALTIMFGLSWGIAWTISAFRDPLGSWGLREIDSGGQRWLVMDVTRTTVGSCTLSGHSVVCFQMKE